MQTAKKIGKEADKDKRAAQVHALAQYLQDQLDAQHNLVTNPN